MRTDTGSKGKIGVSQMFVAAVTELDREGNYKSIQDNLLVNFDEEYHNESLEELDEAVRHASFGLFTIGEEAPAINLKDMRHILEVLQERTVKFE